MSTTAASMDAMKANLTDRLTNHKAPFRAASPDAAAARFFPGGHMGHGPHTLPTVVGLLRRTAGIAV